MHLRRIVVIALLGIVACAALASAQAATSGSTTVYVTKTGAKYHRAGCSSLSRSSIPMTLADATKRYGPCSRCKPPVLATSTTPTPRTAASPATANAGDGRCEAITKKGTRCLRSAKPGTRYCWQHGGG